MFLGSSGHSNGHSDHGRPRPRRPLGGGGVGWSVSRVCAPSTALATPTPHGANGDVLPTVATLRHAEYDKAYFQSYSHLAIHEEMIKDFVRTDAYRDAIMKNQQFIAEKVVMDVGCGTGILAIFCARAGARRVYAVEASEIALQAREIVKENNLEDKVIVCHSRVEDLDIEEKVDVIISEWMGYMLFYESMLASILCARDKWLKPNGLILPSHATLYMAPITNSGRYQETVDFWRNVYGIKMSAVIPLAKQLAFEEPAIEMISGENVLSWPFEVKRVDCYTVKAEELISITTKYKVTSMLFAPLHGFAFWFDVEFNRPAAHPSNQSTAADFTLPLSSSRPKRRLPDSETVLLSTAPEDPPTHWQQTILYFYEPVEVKQDQTIEGSVTLSQSKENPRFLNIHLEYSTGGRSFVKESVLH